MARRAYLSGGMEYATDEGRDWRSEMQSWLEGELGCTVFNPNVESDRLSMISSASGRDGVPGD